MAKCKFYSKNSKTEYYTVVGGTDEKYEVGMCTNSNCILDHCYFSDCFNNCECFEPDREGVITARLITDKDKSMDRRTLTIQNCDKIILKPKSLEVEIKIEKDNFDDFNFIVINGHKFKKV